MIYRFTLTSATHEERVQVEAASAEFTASVSIGKRDNFTNAFMKRVSEMGAQGKELPHVKAARDVAIRHIIEILLVEVAVGGAEEVFDAAFPIPGSEGIEKTWVEMNADEKVSLFRMHPGLFDKAEKAVMPPATDDIMGKFKRQLEQGDETQS